MGMATVTEAAKLAEAAETYLNAMYTNGPDTVLANVLDLVNKLRDQLNDDWTDNQFNNDIRCHLDVAAAALYHATKTAVAWEEAIQDGEAE